VRARLVTKYNLSQKLWRIGTERNDFIDCTNGTLVLKDRGGRTESVYGRKFVRSNTVCRWPNDNYYFKLMRFARGGIGN
jgi:hypothetical protein